MHVPSLLGCSCKQHDTQKHPRSTNKSLHCLAPAQDIIASWWLMHFPPLLFTMWNTLVYFFVQTQSLETPCWQKDSIDDKTGHHSTWDPQRKTKHSQTKVASTGCNIRSRMHLGEQATSSYLDSMIGSPLSNLDNIKDALSEPCAIRALKTAKTVLGRACGGFSSDSVVLHHSHWVWHQSDVFFTLGVSDHVFLFKHVFELMQTIRGGVFFLPPKDLDMCFYWKTMFCMVVSAVTVCFWYHFDKSQHQGDVCLDMEQAAILLFCPNKQFSVTYAVLPTNTNF